MPAKKIHTAAILTINAPGKMSTRGRLRIVEWLNRQADHFRHHGSKYTTTRFTARYLYEGKKVF